MSRGVQRGQIPICGFTEQGGMDRLSSSMITKLHEQANILNDFYRDSKDTMKHSKICLRINVIHMQQPKKGLIFATSFLQ